MCAGKEPLHKRSGLRPPRLKSQTLQRRVSLLSGIIALGVLPLYAVKVWLKTDYTDFEVYYRAAARAAAGDWQHVYSLSDGASPFRYAPPMIPFFRPFAALSYEWAKIAWFFFQYVWFALGFYFIYLTLDRILTLRRYPKGVTPFCTALSMLFILRFCLDCFTIGQISSLLFLALAASLYFWTCRRSGWASGSLLFPALVKIGPGFLYPLLLHGRPRARLRAIVAPILALAGVLAVTTAWIGPWTRNRMLWAGWYQMVAQDSTYYDASHYGSQSIKSALLRMVRWDWVSSETAMRLYLLSAILVCGAVLFFWLWRFPRKPLGRAAAFALGIFPYIWVMPETFKYTLTALAIPVSLLFADLLEHRSRFSIFALSFGAATLSLAGKDVVGDFLFFGSQKASVPLLATFFLGAATARLAWRESRDSWFAREMKGLFKSRDVQPWENERKQAALQTSLLAPLPMHSKVSLDSQAALAFLKGAHEKLKQVSGEGRFEILIQPYGDRLSEAHPLWAELRALEGKLAGLKLLRLQNPSEHFPTRNAALRESFLSSQGATIWVAHLEQPCDPDFYVRAAAELESGVELVRGNRRMHATRFKIPVRLLSLVYRRHRLGLRFNRIVRLLLPIGTTDTHSGILAMSGDFASKVFALQSSMDFLFDLEIALVAKTHQIRQKDLPLVVHLAEEKSHRRMAFETLSILLGLPRLAHRYRKGCYQPIRLTQRFTADDWGLTPEVNQGILDLARRGVVKRVSLMARSSYFGSGLDELKSIPGIELGLHFDLTYGKSPPSRVLLSWLNPFADRERLRAEVRSEFQSQLGKLRSEGVTVSYLDGHHHIHLVPGIIDALAGPIREAGILQLRCPYDPSLWPTPKAVLNLLSLLAQRGIRRNSFVSLPCFYPQCSHFSDPGLLRAGLARNEGSEVIVHPARSNDLGTLGIPDAYTDGRVVEYRALRMLEHLTETRPRSGETP